MFWRNKHDFRYVFPGQARSNIAHNRKVLKYSIAFGVCVSALVAVLIWLISNPTLWVR